ncbi:hypothetical protein [Demequina sp. NBRC 110051]|uniref:protein kinase domain-containing protein n=1 Tax=Demequina sp. NBRC 110051 TaxID=1570340 RepID=UPI001356476A|nr:hypothetical protein [Demequina sp. NBRC 110051]
MSPTVAAPASEGGPPAPSGVLTRRLGSGAGLGERVRARARTLVALGRDDVLAPWDVDDDGTAVSVTLPVVAGMDLAQVAASRPPLADAEVRWLGARIAAALAAMHAAGLAHGDVSPANVVLRRGGVTLVDTLGAEVEIERGTPGFRAPERVGAAATPAGDVYSLGRLLRWAACEEDEPTVRRWTAPLVASRAAARPSAAAAADLLARAGRRKTIELPRDDVAVAFRSRALERTERVREGRWWRLRRLALRAVTVAAALGAAGWLTVSVPPLLDAAAGPAAAHTPAADAAEVHVAEVSLAAPPRRSSPEAAATALTQRRIEALATADATLLESTVSGRSDVAQAAAHTARQLATGALRYDGIDVDVEWARLVREDRGGATVRVVYVIGDHRRIDEEGAHDVAPAREAVLMELGWAGGAWTVTDARAA